MSHIDIGPLAGYNSLTDQHLAGYFNNTRMRKHLVKSGLITRQGEVVPESVYRLNSSRKDHRRNVRDLLAQAIVHKTLDYERSRQVAIRRKLEEIAKIEMVRRVRAERHRKGDEEIVPLMSPRVRRPRRAPNRLRDSGDGSTSDSPDQKQSMDPIYVDSHGMPMSPDAESRARLLRKFPEEEIDSKHLYSLDSVALREYAKVLERYERGRVARSPYMMSQLPRPPTAASATAASSRKTTPGASGGRGSKSAGSKTKPANKRFAWKATKTGGGPSLTPIHLPPALPPNSPNEEAPLRPPQQRTITVRLPAAPISPEAGRRGQKAAASGDSGVSPAMSPELAKLLSAMGDELQFRRSMGFARLRSPASEEKGTLVMHRPEPAVMQQSRFQSLCEVEMRYYGQNLGGAAAREDMDPKQEVLVEQQHCGGNTLIVFKKSILPGTNFSFFSRRHRGYPFSLTFYINGVKDSRLSTCCEYRHSNGSRLGGKQGHFGFVKVKGAAPCYKCQVERGMIATPSSKEKKKKKSKEEEPEDGYGAASADYDDDEFEEDDEAGDEDEMEEEEIGVAVEDDDDDEEYLERDELGPLGRQQPPVEVAVESDAGSQTFSPTPPPTQPPEAPVTRGARRGKRLRHPAAAAAAPVSEEESERRLLAQVARDIDATDDSESDAQGAAGRRKMKRRAKSKLKVNESPPPGSTTSTAESISLPPSASFEEEEEEEEESKEKEKLQSNAEMSQERSPDDDKEGSQETKNDADEEVDKDFSEEKEWSIDSKELEEKDTPDAECVEDEEQDEKEGNTVKVHSKSEASESTSEVKEEKISTHSDNESKRQIFRTKGKLERSKVMEERVDGEESEIDVESSEYEEKTKPKTEQCDARESLEREARPSGETTEKTEEKDKKEERQQLTVEKEATSSPRGTVSTPMPTSPASEPTENEYQEDFEVDPADEDKEATDASDAEEKESEKSASSKSSSASGSPRSSGAEDNEREVDRLLRSLSSSSRASIRRVCVLMAREICLHFVECRNERRRLRRALRAARHRADSEKKEEKEGAKEDDEGDVHPIGFNDEEETDRKPDDDEDDKGSARSSSSSSSSASSSKEEGKDSEKKEEEEKVVAVAVEGDDSAPDKENSLATQPSQEVSVEEDEATKEEEEKEEDKKEEEEQKETEEEQKEEEEKKEEEEEKTKEEEEEEEPRVVAISLFTGDELGAGTNSHIFCRLIGTEANSDILEMGRDEDVDRFERGSVDSFRLPMKGLKGELKELEVWHDGSGLGATWFLDKATVTLDGKDFQFEFRNWVEGDRGDGDHHHFIPVSVRQEDKAVVDDNKSSSSEASSSEDEEAGGAAQDANDSSSPSSSSDEEEKEEKAGPTAKSPDGGLDPDASKDFDRRPVLSEAADEVTPFYGKVNEFVKAPDGGEGGYSVEVINTALTTAQLKELGQAMSGVPIECLNIRNGHIDDEKLEILLEVLEQKSDLKLLNLNCNAIGAAGARQIAERIPRWSRLEMLLLHGNPLLDDGTEAIVSAIISRHLSGDRVEGMRSLDLGDSEMTNQGAYVVAQLLSRDTPLDSLELTGNRKIGVDGWRRIGEALGRNAQLRTLSVDYCGLEDQQLKQLTNGLPYNSTLASLDLEGNELTEAGGNILRDMLVENGSITDISLRPGNDRLSDDVVEELMEMARNNVDD